MSAGSAGWIALDTPDADWAFSIDFVVGGNLDTYAGTGSNIADEMDAQVSWLNDAGRPWAGTTTFAWRHGAANSRGAPTLASDTLAFRYSPDATAIATIGSPAHMLAAQTTNPNGAIGAWYPASGVSILGWLRELAAGEACGNGGIRPGVPGLARFAPPVEAWATAAEVAVLADVLRESGQPRKGKIYDAARDLWRLVSVGVVTCDRSPSDSRYYSAKFACRGEAL